MSPPNGPPVVPSPGPGVPPGSPEGTDRVEYVFIDALGNEISTAAPGPPGRRLPGGAPPGAVDYQPLWLDEDGEIVGERPPALVARNLIGVPGKKFKGRTVGGPQFVKRDRSYRPTPVVESVRRRDIMISFSGIVGAGQVFYQFLSPADGLLDNFILIAPEGAVISMKQTPREGAASSITQFPPATEGLVEPPDKVEVLVGSVIDFWSSVEGDVKISAVMHARST